MKRDALRRAFSARYDELTSRGVSQTEVEDAPLVLNMAPAQWLVLAVFGPRSS